MNLSLWYINTTPLVNCIKLCHTLCDINFDIIFENIENLLILKLLWLKEKKVSYLLMPIYTNSLTEVVCYCKTSYILFIIIYYIYIMYQTLKIDWLQIDLTNTVYTGCIFLKHINIILLITNVLWNWKLCSYTNSSTLVIITAYDYCQQK